MQLDLSAEDLAFRDEVRAWLAENLSGELAEVRGRGWPGDMDGALEGRRKWEARLAAGRWTCLGWPIEHGGRAATLVQEVIFNEEYVRSGAPGRLGHIGETLLGPTLIAFGTDEQKKRFLPPIVSGEELWCQGYSEPNAGSDLANVQCKAERHGDEWVLNGQKIWTSLAAISDWCFALARTDASGAKHHGITFLLVPMHQPGVRVVPIRQITGTAEFAEVFFEDARTAASNVVGAVDGGWKVAMGLLAFERGASTLAQQLQFQMELERVIEVAKANGAARDPLLRQRLADAWIGLRIMRLNALRVLSGAGTPELSREALITKLYWASWHRRLGELAVDVLGAASEILDGAPYQVNELQRLYLWTRADTIYAGTNQIQRNIIAERGLGLPR
ncbi:MAG: acyl-CoA dehydrogenase family protein [bacterium]